ncbi:MAG TPA: SOS response-associated peptidase family protein [Hyphomonadaceae bacterium]|jgi:putative SOS response-associated peptidase YedK|nr:SOS response-associated peptidase family protein [Hyphomonadaceae bacterium]
MCGKFTQLVRWEDAAEFSGGLPVIADDEPSVFATPMRSAKIIRLGEDGSPELVPMRWGFCNPEAAAFKPDHMHARAETIDSRPTFAGAFAERRGILPVETFNEAEDLPGGKRRQWVIRPKDRKPIPIAVIWEDWEGPDGSFPCFVMVTVPPNELIARVTDRMPAILPREDWPVRLGETEASAQEIKALLRTFEDGGNWEMAEQQAAKKKADAPPKAKAKAKPQMDLF